MLLKPDARFLLVLAFVLVSLSSAIYISIAAINNLSLYPALDEIGNQQLFKVSGLILGAVPGTNQSRLEVQISVTNPTQYSGLQLSNVDVMTRNFTAQSSSGTENITLTSYPNASEAVNNELQPASTDTVTVIIPLSSNQASILTHYNSMHPGQVFATVDLRVDISTFLVSAIGAYPYTRTQEVSLSFQ